ncbi:J domain-containing protein [Cyanobacterium sp. IPPAS B-1200]|uniref:J domain-containing protein n=1 Tax=Cyanobacterium sp. IPPAS B-1200 TaxID=1562720 RepID=UPI0008524C5F|nr:J domain-containing protein [Cyanobacterium sp. IPPAS B-1200]OEJ78314.1 molecular chaperone DnaJ [Cyanobacterium sp. IPPAS B-1200]
MDINLEECYQVLEVDDSAEVEDIEKAYFRIVGECLKRGEKERIETVKNAYQLLINHRKSQQEEESAQGQRSYEQEVTNNVARALRGMSLMIKVEAFVDHLEIKIRGSKPRQKATILNLIYQSLKLSDILQHTLVKVVAQKTVKTHFWQEDINFTPNRNNQVYSNDYLLLQEAEKTLNTYVLPIAGAIALAFSFAEVLTWFIGMWVHEFGHATIAWFSGYRAMITFGATITTLEKSNFVYFGILFLLGLTFYTGWKEKKNSPMIVAVILIILQFIFTWIVSYSDYVTLMAFGGIGGEFYLSTLLIIAFYWRLPEKFYWDFWRFGSVAIGAITFFSSFTKWHNIKVGRDNIPWGTLWGGRGDSGGDLNILNDYSGWSANQIIGTYVSLSNICLMVIIGFYLFHLFKSRPELWVKIRQLFR